MPNRRTVLTALACLPATVPALAEDREIIDARIRLALNLLYQQEPDAKTLADRARAMLVMPEVLKGGFVVGGAYGEGGLLVNDAQGYQASPSAYFSVAAASFGLQAGIQTTSHVLFFMTEEAATNFQNADGWEIGADAEVTFPEKGLNLQVNSTILNKPVIAFVFAADGILLGASLEGSKYSRIAR